MVNRYTHVIVIAVKDPSKWGKGKSVAEAIASAKTIKTGDEVQLILCGDSAHIDGAGNIVYKAGEGYNRIGVGKVRRGKKEILLTVR